MTVQSNRNSRWLLPAVVRLAPLLVLGASTTFATGFYGPTVYLEEGGRRVIGSPEFFWDLEVKRLARDFRPPEKLIKIPLPRNDEDTVDIAPLVQLTVEADEKDFAAALQEGAIKPPDAVQAAAQHNAARSAIADPNSASLPAEVPSEFAD